MVTCNATTPAFIFTPRGTPCPRVVTADFLNADPEVNTIIAEVALMANAILPNDDGYSYTVLMGIVDAIQDEGGIVTTYRNETGVVKSRVLFPRSVTISHRHRIVFKAYCSVRREVRTFALDGVLDCHALTLPFEQVA
jgi:predicted DNA-binding transcriptional regulator YafY